MMEKNVVSLETAKKLKAAGFPQETAMWWRLRYSISELGQGHEYYGKPDVTQRSVNIISGWYVGGDARREVKPAVVRWYDSEVSKIDRQQIAAPAAQEIADELPKVVDDVNFLSVCYPINLWVASYTSSAAHPHPSQISRTRHDSTGETMAEALAALYLKLYEGE